MTSEEIKNIVRHVFHFYEANVENYNWADMNEACGEIFKALDQDTTVAFDFELYEAGLMDMPKEMIKILDKIKDYISHIKNTGLGKKKSLEFIEKFIDGLKAESEDKV